MKRNRARALWILPAAAVCSAICLTMLTGCPWDPPTKIDPIIVPDEYLPQTDPDGILANLKMAYTKENYDQYAKLFSQDYIFVFNPADVNGDDPTPVQWARQPELDAAKNMFDDEKVTQITLTWNPGTPESAADKFPAFPECLRVRVDDITLRVETRPPDLAEPLIYLVQGAYHYFYFKEGKGAEAGVDPTNSLPIWYLFQWEDSPIGG